MVSSLSKFILLSAEQMRASEAGAIAAGVSSASLMEAAGRACADIIIKAWSIRPVLILCGPGNNGGDGFVVARRLQEAGWPVTVAATSSVENLSEDAKLMAGLLDSEIKPFSPSLMQGVGLVVDAIFGTGLSRPIEDQHKQIIEAVNASRVPVLSVDLPSGINADTGSVMGAAIRAMRTVTFFQKKPAHALMPGRLMCGTVDVVDIGIEAAHASDIKVETFENHPAIWGRAFVRPSPGGHKYHRGSVYVLSGVQHQTGAARLAAQGALRAGAGLVTVLSPKEALATNAAHLTSIMLAPIATPDEVKRLLSGGEQYKRVGITGPAAGVGGETRANTLAVLSSSSAAVVDADALTSFADDASSLFAALRPQDVLTPHGGEFLRLFPDIDLKAGKLSAVREASVKAGAIVVLKGPDTVVASPDGRAVVNVNAPPDLAIAGSGDVLAGIIAGFLAQGMAAFEAACAGVWFHGACGQVAGPGLIAEDLPGQIPTVLKSLFSTSPGGDTDAAAATN